MLRKITVTERGKITRESYILPFSHHSMYVAAGLLGVLFASLTW